MSNIIFIVERCNTHKAVHCCIFISVCKNSHNRDNNTVITKHHIVQKKQSALVNPRYVVFLFTSVLCRWKNKKSLLWWAAWKLSKSRAADTHKPNCDGEWAAWRWLLQTALLRYVLLLRICLVVAQNLQRYSRKFFGDCMNCTGHALRRAV